MIENAGYGAGGGIIGVILSYLGFKQRMDRADKDIANIYASAVFQSTCDVCHGATNQRLDSIEKKIDILIERRGTDRD